MDICKYIVLFQKGKKKHQVIVKAAGIVPAIELAIHKHIAQYTDGLGYEIISAQKLDN